MYKCTISIDGISSVLPSKFVYSKDLEEEFNLESGAIYKKTGLKLRRYFSDFDDLENCVKSAVSKALKMANKSIEDIDCIINASATMMQSIPYNAAHTHRLLEVSKPIPSFDINMTCLSMLRAFDVASHLLGVYKNILLVSSDYASAALDWSDFGTAGIFGDGATAMVLSDKGQGGILFSDFQTFSSGYEFCQIAGGGSKCPPRSYSGDYTEVANFAMNGKKLYQLSAAVLPNFIFDNLKKHGLSIDEIDHFVPHQASAASLRHIVKMLGVEEQKVINIFETHANQVASSIPSALAMLFESKRLRSGDKVMLVGTSAGLGLGMVVWEAP